jgi:hypothetical protein
MALEARQNISVVLPDHQWNSRDRADPQGYFPNVSSVRIADLSVARMLPRGINIASSTNKKGAPFGAPFLIYVSRFSRREGSERLSRLMAQSRAAQARPLGSIRKE